MTGSSITYKDVARAKVNLTLHVGRVNENGYHPLQSLVVFADIADKLCAKAGKDYSLDIDGPFASQLSARDNLVLNAARRVGGSKRAAFRLVKNLPVASGLGGGSADAAAAVRVLRKLNQTLSGDLEAVLLEIGADVPVCYLSKTCIMEGVGERLTPIGGLGQLNAVLVNPGVAVSTQKIFEMFDQLDDTTRRGLAEPLTLGDDLLEKARGGRNDLQNIAIGIAPVIQTVLDGLEAQAGCQLARMSGSGATCFGVFETPELARAAAVLLKEKHPDWWCAPTVLGEAV
ncbi:MAG: 4-(cytidine 5'-diphospho)-2-C-methyl-D-erythritol kinase [Robiginitomaculum sp.]|nr:MAG: 4-(cytidine 5'-diphospho)-2-C-methyl-D-erythritol kinase [Robiginitomaculum sp.]